MLRCLPEQVHDIVRQRMMQDARAVVEKTKQPPADCLRRGERRLDDALMGLNDAKLEGSCSGRMKTREGTISTSSA